MQKAQREAVATQALVEGLARNRCASPVSGRERFVAEKLPPTLLAMQQQEQSRARLSERRRIGFAVDEVQPAR